MESCIGPLKRPSDAAVNVLKDKYGETFGFYADVPEILHRLRDARVVVAAASRTSAPRLYVAYVVCILAYQV